MRHAQQFYPGLLLFLFCGADASRKPPAETRFSSKTLHCAFVPPAGWQRKADLPPQWAAFLAPTEQGFRANFSVHASAHVQYARKDEKQFFAAVKKEYAGHGDVFDTKSVKIGEQTAFVWRTHLHTNGLPDLENRQIYTVVRGHSIELTFTMLPALKPKYDPVCNQILASLQFDE